MIRLMKNAFCYGLLLLAVLLPSGLRAQSVDKLETKPHLALAMPFAERQGGVGMAFPVLVNQRAVVTPKYMLRVIYNPPRADDAEVLAIQTQADKEVAYTRVNKLKSEKRLTKQEMAVMKVSRETHWPNVNMFQLALANAAVRNLRIVYVDPDNMEDFYDEEIELIDGMLIGNKGGRFVDVLAVEKNSRADAAGVEPGDKIRQVGREAVLGDLLEFASSYQKAKKASGLTSSGGVDLVLQNEGGETREVVIKAPTGATLNSGMLDVTLDDLGVSGAGEEAAPPMPEIGVWKQKAYDKVKEKTGQSAEEIQQVLTTEEEEADPPVTPKE